MTDPPIETRLRQHYLQARGSTPPKRPRSPVKARNRLALAALVALGAVAGALTLLRDDNRGFDLVVVGRGDSSEQNVPSVSPAMETSTRPPGGEIPAKAFWTGTELLLWSAFDGFHVVEQSAVGLRLDLSSLDWMDLPPAPVEQHDGLEPVAWTGTELVICCGPESGEAMAMGFDADREAWRELPTPPIAGAGTGDYAHDALWVVSAQGAARYDPSSNEWTELPPPPVSSRSVTSAWSEAGWVIWPSVTNRVREVGALFDLETETWLELPPLPQAVWPATASIVVAGNRLLVVGGLPARAEGDSEAAVGAILDLDTRREWVPVDFGLGEPVSCVCNLGSQTVLRLDQRVFVHLTHLASSRAGDGALFEIDMSTGAATFLGADSGQLVTSALSLAVVRDVNGFRVRDLMQLGH